MFRSRASQEDVHHVENASFEEDTIEQDVGTFSFFGFNLFELDETLQHDVHDDESVHDDKFVETTNEEAEEMYDSTTDSKCSSRRGFWQSARDSNSDAKDVSVLSKIKGNLSRTLGNMKPTDLNFAERIRFTSRRGSGKTFDCVRSNDCDSRDDFERSRGATYVDSFDSMSRDINDDEGRMHEKKCFPSWNLKKNRVPAGILEPMHTIKEAEAISTVNVPPAKKTTQSERYAVHDSPSHRHHHHHHHHRSSASRGVGTTRHSSSKYDQRQYVSNSAPPKLLRATGAYIKPSNYDDNIWDDASTSSGWFSLESLDAR